MGGSANIILWGGAIRWFPSALMVVVVAMAVTTTGKSSGGGVGQWCCGAHKRQKFARLFLLMIVFVACLFLVSSQSDAQSLFNSHHAVLVLFTRTPNTPDCAPLVHSQNSLGLGLPRKQKKLSKEPNERAS